MYMQNSLRRQDSIREETEPKDDDNQNQGTQEPDKTVLVNGYSDSQHQENENITVISVDYDPASNSKTSTVVEGNTTSVEECATEVVQVCGDSNMFLVQEESTTFCCVETVVEEHSSRSSASSMSDDVGSSVAFTEAVVQDLSLEGSVACAAELAQEDMQVCELVECTESVQEEFQVAVVECDDNISVYNLGSSENIAQTHEIVMECEEKSVEQVPLNPVEKALIRRGYACLSYVVLCDLNLILFVISVCKILLELFYEAEDQIY